ncbi:DUF6445 family protein [Litorimonas sp. RW-G-Af-16]|uniref:DUF6445 family protein n=1 Tax=Litorimonas sp. RW-G-Af-16 TaxID=3241168 RepID=UPI00390C4CEC
MADREYIVERFGREQEPVVIIDDFYSDPESLIAHATSLPFERRGQFYPGIRAAGNVNYLGERMALLTSILQNEFDVKQGVRVVECNYSLVTTPPHALTPIQCLPHFDGLDRGRFAVLHYLSEAEKGGTAFYRHRGTGFETMNEERFETYKKALHTEAAELGLPPQRYFNQSTSQFEQVLNVPAKPNRLIIYRGVTLHSGYIPDDLELSDDPMMGRLTLNTFLQDKS